MIRSLKKDPTSYYFKHEFAAHALCATHTESELVGESLVFRFTAQSVDQNQRMDEEALHTDTLHSITIDDAAVIEPFLAHYKRHAAQVAKLMVHIRSKGKLICLGVKPTFEQQANGLRVEFDVLTHQVIADLPPKRPVIASPRRATHC